jgi:deoxyribonuclease-4
VRVGAHVSVASGYEKTVDYLVAIGAECAQIFAKSPRQWQGPPPKREASERFEQLRAEKFPGPVFTHTAYLINLATDEPVLRERSIAALADEIARGSVLKANGVVTHIGTAPDGDLEAAAMRVGEAVARAFELASDLGGDLWPGTRLLLENTAGGGSTFGCAFEQLGESIAASGLPAERLGMCLDTCHAFAFGFALDTPEGWRFAVDEIADAVGLDRLGLIHANDCLFERGSRRDRHAWIGDGFIGTEGFSAMVCTPELAGVCAITEMPGEPPEKDEVNLGRLKAIRDACDEA